VRVEAAPPTGVGSTAAVHLALRDTLKDALDSWDASRFEQTLALAAATVPTDDLAEALLAPIAREVGERWASGDISIAQERIASAAIRKVVLTAVNAIKPTAGHRSIVLATLPGERHELGILLAGLVASTRRFGCHFVGADAPAAETARMTERTGACAVGIGVVLPPDLDTVLADLAELCRLVGEGTPVFVGGAGAGRLCGLPLPANCHLVGDLKEFADRLELTAEA
jgi:cobalamin-dependent methionine synthase I